MTASAGSSRGEKDHEFSMKSQKPYCRRAPGKALSSRWSGSSSKTLIPHYRAPAGLYQEHCPIRMHHREGTQDI